mmetsp:Transcript_123206/g.195387  ORF Transcript_123206/g.195387 Transcript_123206/m.195387 type:complete len:111 (-) Transcript_123206:59-391(-)
MVPPPNMSVFFQQLPILTQRETFEIVLTWKVRDFIEIVLISKWSDPLLEVGLMLLEVGLILKETNSLGIIPSGPQLALSLRESIEVQVTFEIRKRVEAQAMSQLVERVEV